MHRLLVFLFSLCYILSVEVLQAQNVVINEFMASNATTLSDGDGDYEDWIELHNYGNVEVNLEGWALSDTYKDPFRWVFPEVIIAPGEFLLVWASGKDRKQGELHTNFRISSDGEPLLLVKPSENWADMVPPVRLPADISFGRKPDGHGDWFYFDKPTPAMANHTEAFSGITEPPGFSHQAGLYTERFQLQITHPDPEVEIVYSLDGSEPALNNLEGVSYNYKNEYAFHPGDPMGELLESSFGSYLYHDSLWIEPCTHCEGKLAHMATTVHTPHYFPDFPVVSGYTVRARAFKQGYLPGEIITRSYFFPSPGTHSFTLPVVSIAIQENDLFDYYQGIYTPGYKADKWREENPNESFSWPFDGNFHQRGVEWEVPANIEFFEPGKPDPVLNQKVGIRIHGGGTRSFPMKSLRIYARNRYGASTLDYPFFKNNIHSSFKRLLLRNSGQDFPNANWSPSNSSRTMFRDAYVQTLVKSLRFDTQDYTPAIVYINGEYWGIHNIRERYDKHYLYRVYQVKENELDLLTHKHSVKEGNNYHYLGTLHYIENNSMAEEEHWAHVHTLIDIENFTDYQIANIFIRNTDWPGNNIDFWRKQTSEYDPDAPPGHDGRWRWLLFDTDFGYGLVGGEESYKHNTLEFATADDGQEWPNPAWSTFLLRSFLENESYRMEFVNRFADLMNTVFLPSHSVKLLDSLQALLKPEIPLHLMRWSKDESLQTWLQHVDVMRTFAKQRPEYQTQHLIDFFGLNGTVMINLDVSHELHGHVKINTIDIVSDTPGIADMPYPWAGQYFEQVPITIKARPAPGYRFSHWEGSFTSTDSVLKFEPGEDLFLRAVFETTEEQMLLYSWTFDTRLPNDMPLEEITATYGVIDEGRLKFNSCLPGYPYEYGHWLWRRGSAERYNSPTPLNYRPEGNLNIAYANADLRGLQVRQPLSSQGEASELIFYLPTTGARDVVFRFAAKDEGAAESLRVYYSVKQETFWKTALPGKRLLPLSPGWQLYEVDFSHVPQANDNPWFKIRIQFNESHPGDMNGQRVVFNNFTLDGVKCMAWVVHANANSKGDIHPDGYQNVFSCSRQVFNLTPQPNHILTELTLDMQCVLHLVDTDENGQAQFVLDGPFSNHRLRAVFAFDTEQLNEEDAFRIYPNPVNQIINISAMENIMWVKLFDLGGRLLLYEEFESKNVELDLGNLDSGMYVIHVRTEKRNHAQNILLLRESD